MTRTAIGTTPGVPATSETNIAPAVVPGFFADPNLVVFRDRYFLYPTVDGHADWSSDHFVAFSSSDLETWESHGEILRLGSDVAWARAKGWAPAAAERDGRYYFYFTAENRIGVAVSDSPIGPFTDLGRPLVEEGRFPGVAIDPSVFVDEDGAAYLYWGNGWAHGVRLGEDMMSFDSTAVVSWQPEGFREAAWVHRHDDGYYLSWSVGDTRSADYQVHYATGSTPLGPWTHQGVLLQKDADRGVLATGHHSIAHVPGTDRWVIASHRFAIPGGDGFHREIVIDPLIHRADGTIAEVRPSERALRIPLTHPEEQH